MRLFIAFGDRDKAARFFEALPDDHPFSAYVEGILLLIDSDYQESLDFFSAIIDGAEPQNSKEFPTQVASEIALLANDLEKAREFVFKGQPILMEDAEVQVDRFTIPAIISLAYINQQQGDTVRAQELLHAALPVVQELPRLGWFGRGIQEVQILALLGRKEDSLNALSELVNDGFRSSALFNVWTLDEDPYLATLRDDPRFGEISDRMMQSVDAMYRRVIEAESSGDWESLRAKAEVI